jgi:hypothetical protein
MSPTHGVYHPFTGSWLAATFRTPRVSADRHTLGVGAGSKLDSGDRVWLGGRSPVSGDMPRQLERQREVLAALEQPPPSIAMHFCVNSYTRRGHYFDMESLAYPVLATWRHDLTQSPKLVKLADPYRPRSVWLTMITTEEEQGMWLAYEPSPEPAPEIVQFEFDVGAPPTVSVRGTVIPELVERAELPDAPWLGLELRFDSEVDIAEFGFRGPIKPLIDAMRPILGTDHSGGPADHRLHDLRIRHDERADGGVHARFWYAED